MNGKGEVMSFEALFTLYNFPSFLSLFFKLTTTAGIKKELCCRPQLHGYWSGMDIFRRLPNLASSNSSATAGIEAGATRGRKSKTRESHLNRR